jgi:hypothetical protein
LREEARGIPWVFGVPDSGVVEGVTTKSLYRADGSVFLPSSVQESDCYLDRILPPEMRAVLTQSARRAIARNRRADTRALLEALTDATDDGLGKLFHAADGGFLVFLLYISDEYSLQGVVNPERAGGPINPSRLERDVYSRGVYKDWTIPTYLWLSYLSHLGVKEVRPLVEYLRSLDASVAPPRSLKPVGCPAGIQYQWPTLATGDNAGPYRSFESTHWGVCSSTGKPWIYGYKRRWREARDDEVSKVCGAYADVDPSFSEICRK